MAPWEGTRVGGAGLIGSPGLNPEDTGLSHEGGPAVDGRRLFWRPHFQDLGIQGTPASANHGRLDPCGDHPPCIRRGWWPPCSRLRSWGARALRRRRSSRTPSRGDPASGYSAQRPPARCGPGCDLHAPHGSDGRRVGELRAGPDHLFLDEADGGVPLTGLYPSRHGAIGSEHFFTGERSSRIRSIPWPSGSRPRDSHRSLRDQSQHRAPISVRPGFRRVHRAGGRRPRSA